MKNILLFIALFWIFPASSHYSESSTESNIRITRNYLTVDTKLQHKGDEWITTNIEPIKIGENNFYFILEENLSVELKVWRYE